MTDSESYFQPDPLKELVESLAGRNIIFAALDVENIIGASGLPRLGFQFPSNAIYIDVYHTIYSIFRALKKEWKRRFAGTLRLAHCFPDGGWPRTTANDA